VCRDFEGDSGVGRHYHEGLYSNGRMVTGARKWRASYPRCDYLALVIKLREYAVEGESRWTADPVFGHDDFRPKALHLKNIAHTRTGDYGVALIEFTTPPGNVDIRHDDIAVGQVVTKAFRALQFKLPANTRRRR
jgi:hypothetical protein